MVMQNHFAATQNHSVGVQNHFAETENHSTNAFLNSKTKKTVLMKQYFLPRNDNDKSIWLQNFAGKLPIYSGKYGITENDVIDTQNGAAYFAYWLNYQNQFKEFSNKIIAYKNDVRDGVPDSGEESMLPIAPTPGTAPTAVPAGVFKRAVALANLIKKHASYTMSDGNDLSIEGTETEHPDINTVQPMLSVRPAGGGHPEIVWKNQGLDGIEIYADRGTGWQFLALDTVPNYIDTTALPTVPATWKYKAIYRLHDGLAGQWSDEVSITVSALITQPQ